MALDFIWECDYHDDDRFWTGKFIEDGKTIDDIHISKYDNCDGYYVSWCHGWSMSEGLSSSEYTLDTAKKWCEKWLLERYISSYENTVSNLSQMAARAKFAKERLKDSEATSVIYHIGDVCIYSFGGKNKSVSIVEIVEISPDKETAKVRFRHVVKDDSGNDYFTYLYKTKGLMDVSLKYLTIISSEFTEAEG